MAITEAERAGLAQTLATTMGEEPARTLMNCILPEGRDQLATKTDIERHETKTEAGFALVEAEFVKVYGKFTEINGKFTEINGKFTKVDGKFTELRGHIDLALAKQTRTMVYMLAAFALTTWVSMAGVIVAFVSLAP